MLRARRDRGMIAHWIVICFSAAVGAFVLASESSIGPFHREQQRLRFTSEAFALADAGVAWAHAELDRTGRVSPLDGAALGRGRVSVRVESSDEHGVVVLATGVVPAPLLGEGGNLARRIRARFRTDRPEAASGRARVALLEWKEL